MNIDHKLASLAVMAWASTAMSAAARELLLAPGPSAPAAQSADAALPVSDGTDIIVTARRRNETTLNTPVVLTAAPSRRGLAAARPLASARTTRCQHRGAGKSGLS